jgi:nicotinamide-nucleotide amidase
MRSVRIATAESCTGGLLSGALTDIPGSSTVLDRGFVTYSNDAKIGMLGVSESDLARHGAVSAETARAMAIGAIRHSRAQIAVSITGVAGPSGGSDEKPVGLVYFGIGEAAAVRVERRLFAGGGRGFVRSRAVETALLLLLQSIAGSR